MRIKFRKVYILITCDPASVITDGAVAITFAAKPAPLLQPTVIIGSIGSTSLYLKDSATNTAPGIFQEHVISSEAGLFANLPHIPWKQFPSGESHIPLSNSDHVPGEGALN